MRAMALLASLATAAACARQPSDSSVKIVNGQNLSANDEAARSTVALLINNEELCSATLIGPQQLVTAAHCVDGQDPRSIVVVFATVADPRQGETRQAIGAARNPSFNNFGAGDPGSEGPGGYGPGGPGPGGYGPGGYGPGGYGPGAYGPGIYGPGAYGPGAYGPGAYGPGGYGPGAYGPGGPGYGPGGSNGYGPSGPGGSGGSQDVATAGDPASGGAASGSKIGDIGIIVFDQPAPASYVPVAVAAPSAIAPDTEILLAGFGATAQNQNGGGTLRQTTAHVERLCTGPGGPEGSNCSDGEFIQHNEGHGTCNGDSGGPVFVREGGIEGGTGPLQVVGATSRGDDCDVGNGTYTFVSAYQGWMKCTFDKLGQPLATLADDASSADCAATEVNGGGASGGGSGSAGAGGGGYGPNGGAGPGGYGPGAG